MSVIEYPTADEQLSPPSVRRASRHSGMFCTDDVPFAQAAQVGSRGIKAPLTAAQDQEDDKVDERNDEHGDEGRDHAYTSNKKAISTMATWSSEETARGPAMSRDAYPTKKASRYRGLTQCSHPAAAAEGTPS